MDDISAVLYVCFLIPMLLSLLILESRSRLVVGSILMGSTLCLIASYVNTPLFRAADQNMRYFATTISPVIEEILKALPILLYALFVSNNRHKLVQLSFAEGLGFAIMENMSMIAQSASGMTFLWALMRGFGAGLMHSICTVMVGMGISLVGKIRKLFYCGTVALLMLAITYHSLYNTLVLSPYKYFGILLPLCTYIPILVFLFRRRKQLRHK